MCKICIYRLPMWEEATHETAWREDERNDLPGFAADIIESIIVECAHPLFEDEPFDFIDILVPGEEEFRSFKVTNTPTFENTPTISEYLPCYTGEAL